MLPHQLYEQLVLGLAAGLLVLAALRWVPLLRELLAVIAAAGLLLILIAEQPPVFLGRLPVEVLTYPAFFLGLALAAAAVLAVLYVTRLGR